MNIDVKIIMLQILLIYYYCGDQWRFYDGANGGLAPPVQSQAPQLSPLPEPLPLWGTTKYWGWAPPVWQV